MSVKETVRFVGGVVPGVLGVPGLVPGLVPGFVLGVAVTVIFTVPPTLLFSAS